MSCFCKGFVRRLGERLERTTSSFTNSDSSMSASYDSTNTSSTDPLISDEGPTRIRKRDRIKEFLKKTGRIFKVAIVYPLSPIIFIIVIVILATSEPVTRTIIESINLLVELERLHTSIK